MKEFFELGLNVYFIFIILQLAWHYTVIEVFERVPNHGCHLAIRVVVAIVIMIMSQELSWINILTYGIAFWLPFDSILNLLRGKKIWYLGETPIDKFQKEHPNEQVWFWFKTIAFLGLVGAYYLN